MPAMQGLTETVTIINKSGKIISNGKHLVNIFKDARAAYQERKAALKAERVAAAELRPGIRKAQTFQHYGAAYEYDPEIDANPESRRRYNLEYGRDPDEETEAEIDTHEPRYRYIEDGGRRRSLDDARSYASSRRSHGSHRSGRSSRSRHGAGGKPPRPPLTENNLRTLSEISSIAPSQAPNAYRSPYAESVSRDLTLSKPTLVRAATQAGTQPSPDEMGLTASPYSSQRQSIAVNRATSDPSLRPAGKKKDIDMNLAYGSIPPDLASRTDLDAAAPSAPAAPAATPDNSEGQREQEARDLMTRIEDLLDEADCVHASATSIIAQLQGNPEAAAAVALTLAELSALLAKMSPAFLGVVKGGFPAIFALLASPQFLVAVGVAVGVTVVCFGGWKIVKKVKEAKALQAEKQGGAQAFAMKQQPPMPEAPPSAGMQGFQAGAAYGPGGPGSCDDALVLEEELSTIETWRRGIQPFGEDESVDLELITPAAVRSVREVRARAETETDARSYWSGQTHRTPKPRSPKSHRSHKGHRHHHDGEAFDIPERKSSKSKTLDGASEVGSERTHHSSRSKRAASTEAKALEDGSRDTGSTVDTALRSKDKVKKPNMLKQLFKKKKGREERSEVSVSVMA